MFKLQSPIQKAVRDPKKISKFFDEFKLVPYYGSGQQTSHAYLQLFTDLNKLSPSASSCKADLTKYAFDGELDIAARQSPALKGDSRDITAPERTSFIGAIKSVGLTFFDIQTTVIESHNHYWDTGNKYIHLKIVTVGGATKVTITAIDPLNVMYLLTKEDEPRTVVIDDRWDAQKWRVKMPKMCRVYPDWTEGQERGVIETVFHFQTGIGSSDWYSEPADLASLYWKYSEFSQGNLYSKITSTEVVSKGIFVLPAQFPEENEKDSEDIRRQDFELKVKSVRAVTTNQGNQGESSSVAVMEVPHDSKIRPYWVPFELNRDTANHEFVAKEASAKIYAGFGWSEELSGYTKSSGGIGSDILINLFKIKNQTVIKKLQQGRTVELDIVLGAMWDRLGREEMKEYSIVFPDNISELIQSLKDADDATERI